jgi:uncharacterized membrane protein YebE (DUF533 family)
MNFERILDGLVGAKAKPGTEQEPSDRQRGFIEEALGAIGIGGDRTDRPRGGLAQGFGDARNTLGDWTERAKETMGRNPTLTAGAIAAAAGLLLSGRGRGLVGSLAGVGGMGLIGALAYNAFRKYQERSTGAALPNPEALNPANATDTDAQVLARAMVAAIAADGQIDDIERARIAGSLRGVGLSEDDATWLEREFAKPASAEDLAASVGTPERAAQIYSAARLVIEPDTEKERAFLRKLADALKLPPELRGEIDGGASGLKASA